MIFSFSWYWVTPKSLSIGFSIFTGFSLSVSPTSLEKLGLYLDPFCLFHLDTFFMNLSLALIRYPSRVLVWMSVCFSGRSSNLVESLLKVLCTTTRLFASLLVGSLWIFFYSCDVGTSLPNYHRCYDSCTAFCFL